MDIKDLKQFVSHFQRSHNIPASAAARGHDRTRRAILTIVVAGLARVLTMAVPLITIPVTLHYLGHEIFGLWMTVTSFIGMFAFTDLGIGNGLLTLLSRVQGENSTEGTHQIISAALYVLVVMAIFCGVVLLSVWPHVSWAGVFNAATPTASQAVPGVVAAYVICFLINLPLVIVQRVQMALQEGYRSHLWQCCGSVLTIGAVYVSVVLKLSPALFVFVVSFVPTIILGLNWIEFFFYHRPELRPSLSAFSWTHARGLLANAILFLLLSVLTTTAMTADNYIVAHLCSLETVTQYAIPLRVAAIINSVVTIISIPMWSANGEALARGDIEWVQRNTFRVQRMLVVIVSAMVVTFVVLGRVLFRLWLGPTFDISILLLAGLGVNSICLAAAVPLFMVLNGANRVYSQLILFLLYTPLVIVIKIVSLRTFGLAGLSWAGALTYLVVVLPAVSIMARRAMARTS